MSHLPPPDQPAVTIPQLQNRTCDGRRLVMTTACDAVTARLAEPIVDMLLVGDSVGNVCLGFDDTLRVSMPIMNHQLRKRPHAPQSPACG
jgi:3-methyl-2-oxobutanoate hydroxymethyltransferase